MQGGKRAHADAAAERHQVARGAAAAALCRWQKAAVPKGARIREAALIAVVQRRHENACAGENPHAPAAWLGLICVLCFAFLVPHLLRYVLTRLVRPVLRPEVLRAGPGRSGNQRDDRLLYYDAQQK